MRRKWRIRLIQQDHVKRRRSSGPPPLLVRLQNILLGRNSAKEIFSRNFLGAINSSGQPRLHNDNASLGHGQTRTMKSKPLPSSLKLTSQRTLTTPASINYYKHSAYEKTRQSHSLASVANTACALITPASTKPLSTHARTRKTGS